MSQNQCKYYFAVLLPSELNVAANWLIFAFNILCQSIKIIRGSNKTHLSNVGHAR